MKVFKVLGMMSGTSLDGLDIAYCHIWNENNQWDFEIRQTTTISYDDDLYQNLKNAIHLSEEAHLQLHSDYGIWLGEQAKAFVKKHDLQIDFIASHGHTSHHRPEEGITFQLGDGQKIADIADKKTICDFRSLDMELGGQGAPLVPIGDALLLAEYEFCLNLGGISNMSFQKEEKRLAYDIGLANMPLNYITEKIGLKYDEGGKMAKRGKLIPTLLAELNDLKYYQLPYPKSTGYEWFTSAIVSLLEKFNGSTENLLHTVIHHNCEQIALAIKKEKPKKGSQVLVTGGGALNDFYISTLSEKLGTNCSVKIPPKKFIEFKEALVFAFMGVLKELNEINVLSSVTGAKRNSCSGVVFEPSKI